MWIASLGVHRMLGRGELLSYRRANGLPNEVIWTFLWDREQHLLVGTDTGLARSTSTGWSVVPGTEQFQIRRVVADGDAVWAGGSPASVLRIDAQGVHRYDIAARTILGIARDRSGAIWAATRGGGLLRKTAESDHFERVDVPNGRPNEDFRFVTEDSQGRVWATGENGLACFANGRWKRFSTRDGFVRDYVGCFVETRGGDFWVSYFEPIGIVRFRAEDTPNGVAIRIVERVDISKRIFLLGEDTRKRLWIGTGAGVDIVSAGVTDHIGSGDGLAGDDTDSMAFFCDESGAVFIGTSSGFSRYVGRPDPPRYDPPPVRLTLAQLGKRHDFNAAFSALSFYKPDIVEYEARLVGLDDVWQRLSEPRARWQALPPGDYRFEARARLRPGAWSEPAHYSFSIAPAWWQTNSALALAVLLFIALVWLAFRGRVALLRRRNRELAALVEQRTRELAELSVTDALTGMKNRRYLQHCMPGYVSDALRRKGDLLFFLLDLDWFKQVNDRYGHLAGDEVLVSLCQLLVRVMRESDTIVRWGGEEFLLIARNASRAEAAVIAERMRVAVEEHEFRAGEATVRLTASIGFAAFPFLTSERTRFSWEEVVDVADVCMYAAKRAGRDCWVGVSARDCRNPESLVARMRHDIAEVVAGGELEVHSSREGIPWNSIASIASDGGVPAPASSSPSSSSPSSSSTAA
jgi:diguanylate cyclase (GGDEF)-like protein